VMAHSLLVLWLGGRHGDKGVGGGAPISAKCDQEGPSTSTRGAGNGPQALVVPASWALWYP